MSFYDGLFLPRLIELAVRNRRLATRRPRSNQHVAGLLRSGGRLWAEAAVVWRCGNRAYGSDSSPVTRESTETT